MKEQSVEDHLRERAKEHHVLCEKHVSPGRRGAPDDLLTWPFGEMDLVETKAPLKKARDEQVRDHKRRAERGVPVYLLDTKAKIDDYFEHRKVQNRPKHLFSVPVTEPTFMVSYAWGKAPRARCGCGCEDAPGPICS